MKAAEDDFEYGKPKETERPTLDTKQFMAMTKEQLRKEIIDYFGEKKSVLAKTPFVLEPKPIPFHF